jgi:hypothetical protein
MPFLGWLFLLALLVSIGVGIGQKVKESLSNTKARIELARRERVLARNQRMVAERDNQFKQGILPGRRWLASYIAEAEDARDEAAETELRSKDRPAPKAADVVAVIRAEKRALKEEVVFLKYQVKAYEEYFPFLEEFRDLILDERVPLVSGEDNEDAIRAADPALAFLSTDEYEKLSEAERNQRALDRYVAREKNNWEVGRLYERYLGFLYETDGWRVEFHGAIRGFDDFGRDLICTRGQHVQIVQAKCWSKMKTIHEKHLFQLYGTCVHFRLSSPFARAEPVFACTTGLSEAGALVAKELGITVSRLDLPKSYPMIKCNVNPSTKERIYHLPFDQQYDRTVIGTVPGECYVETVAEAEERGFRRAWRHLGWSAQAKSS